MAEYCTIASVFLAREQTTRKLTIYAKLNRIWVSCNISSWGQRSKRCQDLWVGKL